jgi:single-stranded DNA-binding protein
MPSATSSSLSSLTYDPNQDINRVLLAGTLVETPELRELEDGPAVCFLRLKCTWSQAPQILGDEDQLDVNILLLGERARKIAPYLYNGRRLVVDGSLASASWEQSGAEEQETVCVLGERIEFFDKAPAGAVRYPGGSMTRVLPRPARGSKDEGDSLTETQPMVGFSEDVWF